MSRNYKYDFADQVLIHAQRPDASACAEYDVWTQRMGRYVRRGAKGIALVDYSGDAPRLRYVFDVSDTGARRSSRPFRPWSVNDANLSEVQLGLRQDFGAEGEWLSSQLQDAARDLAEMYFDAHRHDTGAIIDGSLMAGYDESELRDSFIRAVSTSTAYAIISRCGYNPEAYFAPEDFAFLTEWNTPEAATALGTAVSENTQLVLREIERTIRSYERSRYNDRNSLQDSERRTDSESQPARDGANRQVRKDAPALYQGAPAGAVEPARADGGTVRASTRDRDGGESTDRPHSAEAGSGSGRDGNAESRRPAGVDGPHERLQGPGRRSSSERVNIQLNLFDEAEDADAPSAFVCPQEVIDTVLRVGENTSYLRERVIAEFEKQRPLDEIAAFLPEVYHGGVGVTVDGVRYSAWMDADGIRIARGESARYARDSQLVPWYDAAERISELLNAGQYAGAWELERAAATERRLLAEQLWYLRHDMADERRGDFFPSMAGITRTTFPEETERVAALLADREQCEKLLGEYRDFLAAYRADRDIMRFHYHKTDEILASLESQLLPRVQFHADKELIPSPHQFITQDEIDRILRDGGSTSGGKWRIFRYFTEEHSVEDKADFLKREYGIGGRSHALSDAPGSDEKHDSKGMELSKGDCENVRLTWRQVARCIDALIASDRFMTALELAMYDTHTAAYASYNRAKPYHDNDIVLVQYGGAFYTYGADAETAAHALGQRTRQAGGLDYVEIMEKQIEPALDALRAYKPVTLSYENGAELTVDFHLPESRREQYAQRLYEALIASDYYADAVMNSDEENATLTGERVLREYAADSDDRDFQRTYYDNPRLRDELNRAALDAAYHDLSEPPSEDEPVIRPRDPMAPAYNVGDFVWIERRQFEITDILGDHVELLQSGLDIPIYRSESKEYFELYLKQDTRNRQITDFLTADLDDESGQLVNRLLTDEDRAQIAHWLRDGEGNTQISERLEVLLDGRDGIEPDGLHYSITGDNGNIVAAGFLPWEQLAEALRGMYKRDMAQGIENQNDAPDSVHHDLKEISDENEPEFDDTPVNIQPREAMASAYGVGDFVWYEGREYQITDLQRGYVELLPPELPIPVYRTERRADFERGLLADERNRYITDYLTTETDNDAREQLTKTVAYYDAEKTHLPYDVVFQTIGSAPEPEPEPPAPNTPNNFRITDDHLGEGGAKTRFRANMDAITTLKRIEAEGRAATADEQETLSRYTGWGAIPDAFDENKGDWAKEYAELKAALTPEEYEAARGSTLNAHYTSPTVIRAIYDALGNMGFEGGRILEPAMGVGNFFGLLPDSMSSSELHGVELDSITGRIAKQLYPEAEVTVAGFETTNRPGFFDLAVGNVPFGNYQVFDPEYNRLGFSIHNYFAAKMLDQVRPGGIVAFVTSRYTMDSRDESVRRYLAERGELLGAIRLPNNAFRANAGTDVVSDIIFLQRREIPVTELPEWVHVGENEDGFKVNKYFLDHPEMVLGTPTDESTQYGRQDYTVAPIEGADLAAQLHEAIKHIHGEYTEREIEQAEVPDIIPADPDIRNYSFTLVDGDVFYREGGIMVRQDVSATMSERIKGMMELRDCTRRLIELQTIDAGDGVIAAEQRRLNELYDAFTAKHGLISSRENKRAFDVDSSYYLLCSLEIHDDDGNLERKSDMFTKRTIQPHRPVEHTETTVEALAVSMNEKARVDMEYMSRLCGKDEVTIAAELQGVIFRVPGTDHYITADEYLSGNVREKLREAEAAAKNDTAFNINVEALRAAQPRDLTASEIDVRLGATWIEPQYIKQFITETFKPAFWASQNIKVHYSPVTGEWRVEGKSAVGASDVNAYNTYGTQRMNAYKILENTLNLRDVRIYDKVVDVDGTERRVLNSKETTLAQQKQQVIKDAFKDWLWKDADRRQTLVAKYNELFNSTKPREYDGSHLTFPGMNPEITLRKHQRDAIARVLYGGNTLLAHEVGAGKTFTMAAAAMEAKRLGLCSKSMFVVPNHLTEQWASEFLRLYPSANILVTTKKDFEKANRQKFCARIATGNYDAVIIGHSQFEKIPVSQERQEQLLQDQIDEITEGIRELKSSNGERFSIKAMERTKKGLEAKLKKLLDSPRDDVVTFEELGVDRLFVDEAHSHKNLYYQTKMQNVAGLSSSEAQKSSDMYMKCRYLDEKTGSKGVVFATGTPVSNTMVELYTMQRYLQHDTLERLGMNHFDAWAANFGEMVTAMELAPEGTGYRARTRFSKFFNLPELMSIFKEVADIKTADELNLPKPEVVYHNEVSQPTEVQKALVKELSERATKVHSRQVDPSVDNMLAITNDGRKLGLDQRVINPLLPDEPGTKVNRCVDNVFKIWEDTKSDRLTQILFCDLSTPGKGFSVYEDIRSKLVARGVPENEIAFIYDANTDEKKKALFAKVRSGQVRVLMGSTAKMGAGTNVQDRLIALHDLDAPWRPGDLEQRKGRIERQGNMNETVHVYRYVTENSFDSYLWQTLENKQKFISQIMTSKSPVRSCEDVDETTLSFAEIKALCAGDPRIKEKMDLDVQVAKLRLLKSSFQSQRYMLEDNLARYFPREIADTKARIAALESDIQTRDAHPTPSDSFVGIELDGICYTERIAAGEALLNILPTVQDTKPVHIGSFRGFEVEVSLEQFGKHGLTLKGAAEHCIELGADALGNIMRVENALASLGKKLDANRARLADLERQVENAREELEKPFPQEAELAEKSARLIELNAELDMENNAPPEPVAEENEDERPSLLAKLKEPIPLYEPKPQHQMREACR
jgi:N12 class adenine-specific DNA methylase/adenine-specific DNA methylase